MTDAVAAIPLEKLHLSKLNPRKIAPDEDAVSRMAGSIASIGLLQQLIVHEDGDGFGVVAGGVRLRALQRLAEEKPEDFGPSWPVDCKIVAGEAADLAGMAEQAARTPLDPVDEMRGYQSSVAQGHSEADVASLFAVSERYVRQRLALFKLPGDVLKALQAKEIPLYVAEALAADPKAAPKIWKTIEADARRNPGYAQKEIRRHLNFLSSGDYLARRLEKVGEAAYLAEGGKLEKDLFSDAVRIVTPAALDAAEAKWKDAKIAEAARKAGFDRWTEEAPDAAKPIYPTPQELTEKERARVGALEARMEAEEELTAEELDEFDELVDKEETGIYSKAQLDLGTAVVSVDWNGNVSVVYAVIEPDRFEAAVEAGVIDPPAPAEEGDADPEDAAEPWPASLQADLANLSIDVAREQLLDAHELSLWLIAFTVSGSPFGRALSISYDKTAPSGLIDRDTAIDGFEPDYGSDAPTLDEFMKRGVGHRNRVLRSLVAATLTAAGADAIKGKVPIEIRRRWRPDVAFFKRLKKDHLVAIGAEIGAAETVTGQMKKGELVEGLAAIFADPPKEIAQAVNAWLPPTLKEGQG